MKQFQKEYTPEQLNCRSFVNWEPMPWDDVKKTEEYRWMVAMVEGDNAYLGDTKDEIERERDRIVYCTNVSTLRGYLRIGGWQFHIAPYMKRYLYCNLGQWHEGFAFTKEEVRRTFGRSCEVHEIPNNRK